MAWFRRTEKLIVQAFHTLPSNSRLPSHNSIFQPSSRISQSRYFSFATKGATYNRFSKRIGTSGFEINNNFRRFYSVNPQNVWNFMPRGAKDWFQDPKNVSLVLFGVGSGVLITLCFQNMETIPYTNRTHVILVSNEMEKKLGDCVFEKIKVDFKNELLPETHPQSVRVGMIANNILDAMKKTLNKETDRSDLGYGSENARETQSNWHMEDENLDDKWVQKGKEQDSQPYTSHLDGLNWEILVVNKPFVDAFCLPGGKIVVFTGLLEHFSSDAEIATFLGHEVFVSFALYVCLD
ncbi:putative peptidase M48 [Medicago truncatula]|uniref:Putative peptidase M48 n=1 Tax=Medicago truncatula TaxID=3880 RepID=A0A396HL67_MEDTR|nr:putative peptidase M48 [Medicago truncatula]